MKKALLGAVIPIVILSVWYLISVMMDKFYLPTPITVMTFFFNSLFESQTWLDVLASIKRLSIALIISIPISIFIGLTIGMNDKIRIATAPTINFLRVLPITALLPLIIIAFGFSEIGAIFVIILSAGIQTLVVAIHAGQDVKLNYSSFIKNLHLSKFDASTKVVIPAAINNILPSIDLSINAAFRMLIVAELFGAQIGLGYRLAEAAQFLNFPQLYSTLIFVGLLGLIINYIFTMIKTYSLRWK